MLKKKTDKPVLHTEYTDETGRKWVQTSPDDLFAIRELSDVLEAIEKDKDSGDIVLARIDFQKVNKEYYDAVIELQEKLRRKEALLQKLTTETRLVLDRKNKKLNELIAYIRKLHLLLAHYKYDPATIERFKTNPEALIMPPGKKLVVEDESEMVAVTMVQAPEIELDDEGNEIEN